MTKTFKFLVEITEPYCPPNTPHTVDRVKQHDLKDVIMAGVRKLYSSASVRANCWSDIKVKSFDRVYRCTKHPRTKLTLRVLEEMEDEMSTGDVPGANPKNGDDLHAGCWAEHSDGSMIYVQGAEGGTVTYSVFDVSQDPPMEWRGQMGDKDFKAQFTQSGWTWHDKTPFDWNAIMRVPQFAEGARHASAQHQLNAAAELAARMTLQSVSPRESAHHRDQELPAGASHIQRRIQNVISAAFEAWNRG